jgi:dihydroxy-acid dehydratase
MIDIDLSRRTLDVEISDVELAARRREWQPATQKHRRGWLARYARMVTNASSGAVLE